MYPLLKLGGKKKKDNILKTGDRKQGKWYSPGCKWKGIPEVLPCHLREQLVHTGAREQRISKR